MTEFNSIEERVRLILQEKDAEKRLALSRQLRSEVWDKLGEEERAKLREMGLDLSNLKGGLRET